MSEVARTDPLSVCNARSVNQRAKWRNSFNPKGFRTRRVRTSDRWSRRVSSRPAYSAQRDGVITEDPTEFVEPVRKERASKIKRPFGE